MFRTVLFLVTLLPLVAAAQTVVTFPDPNLEAAIRAKISKPTGDILDTDLSAATFTSLSAPAKGITNLSGLEYCTKLRRLELASNKIADLSPISGLTELYKLDLNSNEIQDLVHLTNLHKLADLSIEDNKITSLAPLSDLTEMLWLSVDNNLISDLSHIAKLEKNVVPGNLQ